MRSHTPALGLLAAVLFFCVLIAANVVPSVIASASSTTTSAEIAYIRDDGHIVVINPDDHSTYWVSPTSGWTELAAIDSNGDGIDEVLAIGGNRIRLFNTDDALIQTPGFSHILDAESVYTWVTTGDIVPDDGGLPEILVQRTDNRPGISDSIQVFDGDQNGKNWIQAYDRGFDAGWLSIKTGEVDGLEGDEVILVRNGINNSDKRMTIFKHASNGAWVTIYEDTYNFPWLGLEIGNTHSNNGSIEEIVITRSEVLNVLPSFLIFQYHASSLSDAPNGQGNHFPYWHDIASGDVNGSGDEEVFLIRDPQQDDGISLLGLNWGPDVFPTEWTNPGQVMGRDLQRVVLGDTDGDGKDEVMITTSDSYVIYVEPGSNLDHTDALSADFRAPVAVVLGNFCTECEPAPSPTPTPTPVPACPTHDVNGDGAIDLVDITLVLNNSVFSDADYEQLYDLNRDGIVDVADIFAVAIHFGEVCLVQF